MEVEQLGDGFLVPPLIRFVNGEDAYISMTNGGPHAFFNIEDHLSKSTGVENRKFQVRGSQHEYAGPCHSRPLPHRVSAVYTRLCRGGRDPCFKTRMQAALASCMAIL